MHFGLDRTRQEMLAGLEGPLAKVEVERYLVVEAGRGFERAVSDARANGFSWDQIADHVPGFKVAYGVEAAEKLFEAVSWVRTCFGERHASWRCGDCDGLVLDRGPYGGHPTDAEPGHREECDRLSAEVRGYVAGLDPDDPLAGGSAQAVTENVRRLPARVPPPEVDRGLDL